MCSERRLIGPWLYVRQFLRKPLATCRVLWTLCTSVTHTLVENSANLIHWLVFSKELNRVGVSLPSTWRRKQIQFPKRCIFFYSEFRTKDKVQKPSNSQC
jgi:hypothetical protein